MEKTDMGSQLATAANDITADSLPEVIGVVWCGSGSLT